jgi:predicted porin
MNKKILIAAMGAALAAAPMLAAQADTTLYGTVHMSLDHYNVDTSASGSTEKSLLNSNSTRFGIKGSEDLGSGLKSIYQIESGAIAADDGAGGIGTSTLRNTYVGFAGSSWGAVKIGRHDSPMKELSRSIDQFNEQIGDSRNIIGNSSVSAAGVANNGFDPRVSNMARYDSPDFGGINFALQYSTPEANNAIRYTSGNVTFNQGPLYVGFGYEKHAFSGVVTGVNSAGNMEDETDMRLVGKYNIDAFVFSALYEDMSDLNGISGNDGKAWGLGGGFKMANNLFKVQYYNADATDKPAVAGDNGAKMWSLGADHTFSKTNMVYFDYAKISNDSGSAVGSGSNRNVSSANGSHGTTNVPTPKLGGDGNAYSFGTVIKF